MCESCAIDPVLMLLEELAQYRGYSLVPITPPQSAPSAPDSDAEWKDLLEAMPLDELRVEVIYLQSEWRALCKANADWKNRAQIAWDTEFARWKDKDLYLNRDDFSVVRSKRLDTETERSRKRFYVAKEFFIRRFNKHLLARVIASVPEPEVTA